MPEVKDKLDIFIPFVQEDLYYDLSFAHEPSLYFIAHQEGWEVMQVEDEATDEEVLRYIERSGCLDFLSNPEEDIYGSDDGEAI